MSEQDWQATVLAELGIPLSGLMTPDPAGRPAAAARAGERHVPGEVPAAPALISAPPPEPAADHEHVAAPAAWQGGAPAPPSPPAMPSAPSPPSPVRPAPERPASVPEHPGGVRDEPLLRADDATYPPPSAPDHRPDAPGPSAAPPREPWDQASRESWDQAAQASWDQAPESSWDPAAADPRGEAARQPEAGSWDQAAQGSWDEVAQASWDQASQESWDRAARSQWAPGEPPQAEPAPGPDPRGAASQAGWDRPPSPPPGAGPRPPAAPAAARDLVRKSVHGDPLMRRMSRGVRRAVGVSAADEVRKAADVEAVLGRPVPSCRQIAVTSIRGGAGKTTVAGLTATVIAQYRQDRVLAVDADSGLGSLPLRMGVGPERSLHDLAAARPRSFEETAPYLAHTADGLWVLSGTAGGRIAGELALDTFRAAVGVMSRYFAAAVVDCGAGLLPELQRGILADAHAQVMVTPGTVDGALSAQGALEWQARNGYQHLLARTVIAFVTHTPHVDSDLGRAAQMLSSGGMPVVHIPYDRHLATGTAVESARIGHETRAAVIRIAVEAFARAVSV